MKSPPGFAETGLSLTRTPNRLAAVNSQMESAGQVLPQMSVFLGCQRRGICTSECCMMEIEYVGPDHVPRVTIHCWSRQTAGCSLGDLFTAIF
jgi:hypothetical protein